jgi:hypothetical protein
VHAISIFIEQWLPGDWKIVRIQMSAVAVGVLEVVYVCLCCTSLSLGRRKLLLLLQCTKEDNFKPIKMNVSSCSHQQQQQQKRALSSSFVAEVWRYRPGTALRSEGKSQQQLSRE